MESWLSWDSLCKPGCPQIQLTDIACLYRLCAGTVNLFLFLFFYCSRYRHLHPQICAESSLEKQSFKEEAEKIARIQRGCSVEGFVSQALSQPAGSGADIRALLFMKRKQGLQGGSTLSFSHLYTILLIRYQAQMCVVSRMY